MKPAKTKSRIALIEETALKLFSSAGYDATSVDSIVKTAGVSKGLFYFHYESKGNLLRVMIERALEQLWSNVYQEKDVSIPPLNALEYFVDSYFSNIRINEEKLRLYISMMLLKPELVDKSISRRRKAYRNMIGFVEWIFRRMGFSSPGQERVYFSNLIFGVEMRYLLKRTNRQKELSDMKAMILEKYRARGSSGSKRKSIGRAKGA